jgi:hypothetical protein
MNNSITSIIHRQCLVEIAGFLLLFSAMSVNAIPLSVSETTDFPNSNASTVNLGNFGVGLNTVSGSVKRDSSPTTGGFGDYADFWDANLAVGLKITDIEIAISNHSGEPGFFVGAADAIIGGFGPFSAQAYADLLSDGVYSLSATVGSYPFGPGQYYFGAVTNVGTNTGYSYEWRINVESISVPEPSILALLGIGLAGIGMFRKRA